jgi:hypothetical protein
MALMNVEAAAFLIGEESLNQLPDSYSNGTIDATIVAHGLSCSFLVEKQVYPKYQSSFGIMCPVINDG